SGCDNSSDFEFQTEALALSASSALIDIFSNNIYDLRPELTQGCESIQVCYMVTPYQSAFPTVQESFAANNAGLIPNNFALSTILALLDTRQQVDTTYAVWEKANNISEQPIMAIVFLFLFSTIRKVTFNK
ncbi:hypothetical protein, partial [Photobacterium sanctipauli]